MCLESIENLTHPGAQSFGFSLKSVTDEEPRKARVFFSKRKQQPKYRATLTDGIEFLRTIPRGMLDTVDAGKQAILDKLDQTLEHLRLAGKVSI